MATDEVSVTVKCKKCGGDTMEIPDERADDSVVTCTSCGIEVGLWGEIKKAAVETVKEDVTKQFHDTLKRAFKGTKNVRIK